jgi:hypothetical protein
MMHRRCRYCRQSFQPNRYHPQQQVCNQPACQSQRHSNYHRQKIASDPVYRQICLESPRKWRETHTGYWKKYRRDHPEPVDRNRRQQHLRDQKRRLANLANNTLTPPKCLMFNHLCLEFLQTTSFWCRPCRWVISSPMLSKFFESRVRMIQALRDSPASPC